jgi:hypothetical protein
MGGCRRIPENSDPPRPRHGFFQYLKLLRGKVCEQHGQTRDVPARTREARHVANANGVRVDSEHDGNRSGHLSGGFDEGRRRREDDIDLHADKLDREFR